MLRTRGLRVVDAATGRALLEGVDFDLVAGRVTVLLGASGSGKTLLARSLAGLLPGELRAGGRVFYRGREMDEDAWQGVRGREVFYAPQNAAASLNPVLAVGGQLAEESDLGPGDLEALLGRLRLADPARALRAYPHELSGGECQRCLLALALSRRASVLLLDEPFSEIDAGAHDDLAAVLRAEQRRRGLTVLLVSHQLGLLGGLADRLCVLARGRVAACGDPAEVLASGRHPYVRAIARYLEAP
ncbi:MAG TPA: ATP-binding cassette domain-containing protein [Candidatus Aminicenantes bacterium]|nr:ATP-binding cassette domain-containing protein [Candidatus Aminicenantes bacterium]